jgi:hypothetical protein
MLPNPMSSAVGTKLTARSDRTKSAFGRIADNKCSGRAFPLMTQSGHRLPDRALPSSYSTPVPIPAKLCCYDTINVFRMLVCLGDGHETARLHHCSCQRGGVAVPRKGTAGGHCRLPAAGLARCAARSGGSASAHLRPRSGSRSCGNTIPAAATNLVAARRSAENAAGARKDCPLSAAAQLRP